MSEKPDIVDAEFEVIQGPDERPLRWWEGWRLEWTPWPMIGAIALGGLPLLLKTLQHQ